MKLLFLPLAVAMLSLSVPSVNAEHTPEDCQAGRKVIVDEDFESYGIGDTVSDQGWKNGIIDQDPGFSTFLGRYMEERVPGKEAREEQDPRVIFKVPEHADYLLLSFDFYEIDGWADPDCFYLYINGEKINLNFFEEALNEGYKQGCTKYGIHWVMDSQAPPNQIGFGPAKDQIHHVIAKIPKAHFHDGEVKLRFITQVDANNFEAAGVDNIKIEAFYECGNCEPYRYVSMETFEDQTYSGWLNGKVKKDDPHFTTYLGPYDSTNNDTETDPLKMYIVDNRAEAYTFEFDFYEFDNWEGDDCLYIFINGVRIFLGYYNMFLDEGLRSGEGRKGIKWEVESDEPPAPLGGVPQYDDQKHHVTVHIPKRVFRRASILEIRLSTRVNGTVENESSGFDNFGLIGYYDCSHTSYPTATPQAMGTHAPSITDSPTFFSPAFGPAYVPVAASPALTPAYSPAYTPAYTPAYSPASPSTPAYTPNYSPSYTASPVGALLPSASPTGSIFPTVTSSPTGLRCEDKPDSLTFFVSLEFYNATCSWLRNRPDWISQVCTPAHTPWFWCPITCGRFT